MARMLPTIEQFLVGAHAQLVEGCELVAYNADAPSSKMLWVDVLARGEARPCVFYIDFAEKFDLYFPREMRLDTLVRKLVNRYAEFHRLGLLFEYAPDDVHCQVWLPRPPPRRVAEALPKAVERLRERHHIRLEVIGPEMVAQRIPVVVERARSLSFDYDNLFIRALLLAQGRLDAQAGSPMNEEHIRAMYHFPRVIPSARQLPAFVYQFLTSHDLVHWLDLYSPSLDDLALWINDVGPEAGLGELRQALEERGEVDMDPLDDSLDFDDMDMDMDGLPLRPRTYTARDIAELTRLIFLNADAVLAAAEQHAIVLPFQIEVDFMLPFLWRAQERIDASQIEREILRYGGNRNQMLAHFADAHPDKVPYRAILRIGFHDAQDAPPGAPARGQVMNVDIGDPRVSRHTCAACHLNYAADFTGYFILTMNRVAASLML